MKAMLTLNKADLIAKLEARVEEISERPNALIAELKEGIETLKSAKSYTNSLGEWHAAVAEGLADGSITLTESGKLKNAPARPKMGEHSLNLSIDMGYYRNRQWTEEDLNEWIEREEEGLAATLKPIHTALDLLHMSMDETVQVDSADYQAMLSGNTPGRRYY